MNILKYEINKRRNQVEKILIRFYTEFPNIPHNGAPSQSLRAKVAYATLQTFPWEMRKLWLDDFYYLENWLVLHRALTIISKD